MGSKGRQPSSIKLLPESARRQLQEMLDDPRVTQKAATERINEVLAEMRAAGDPDALDPACPEKVSQSSVNRYDLQMRQVGEKLRQSREVADRWINKLGAAPQGKIGNLVNEILRTLSFDISLHLQSKTLDADSAPAVVGMLKELALTAMRLEKAANLNVEREKEIKRQALEEAAETVSETAREAGVSKDTIARIRRDVLRMSA